MGHFGSLLAIFEFLSNFGSGGFGRPESFVPREKGEHHVHQRAFQALAGDLFTHYNVCIDLGFKYACMQTAGRVSRVSTPAFALGMREKCDE